MDRLVAIVEDDPKEAQTLQNYFSRLSGEGEDAFQVKYFQSSREFLAAYQPIYDLVLLDLQMPDLSGMDTALRLRKLDQNVALVLLTSHVQQALRGYEVEALDFLLKPVSFAVFSVKLRRALARCPGIHSRNLLLSLSDGVYRTSPSRIKYVEVRDHSLLYHTTEGILTSCGTLKQVEQLVDPNQFVRCNRCYLVNLTYVLGIRGSTLILDGAQLQISRPRRSPFLEALERYMQQFRETSPAGQYS